MEAVSTPSIAAGRAVMSSSLIEEAGNILVSRNLVLWFQVSMNASFYWLRSFYRQSSLMVKPVGIEALLRFECLKVERSKALDWWECCGTRQNMNEYLE